MITNQQIFGGQVKEVTDTRTPLQRFRRLGLYYLLRANGHNINEQMPVDKMRKYAEAYEDQIDFKKVNVSLNQFGEYIVEKPDFVMSEERKADTEFQSMKDEYKDMGWKEIRALAKDKGIKWVPGMTKDDLVEALIGNAA
jgi:hypothetical protein